MALSTSFTTLFSMPHPIVLAPMGGSDGGALVAAVSNGGGLGLLGGGNGWDRNWLDRELAIVADSTDRPWGIGFQGWAVELDTVQHALTHKPHAVMLSFGDLRTFVEPVRDAGARVIIQVTDLEEARQAVELGADVIVAQGTEAGGHGARRGRSTLLFVPAVVDLAGPIPVLAAGGIADGRGIAAALTLGAAGALLGARFQATTEALIAPLIRQALVDGRGEDTERGTILDIARGSRWPSKYPARTMGHSFLDPRRGREDELAGNCAAKAAYRHGVASGDLPPIPVWAGEGVDLITAVPSAAELVNALIVQAEDALTRALNHVDPIDQS